MAGSPGGASTSCTDYQNKGATGDIIPVELQFSLSSSVVQVGRLPVFLDQWRSITSNRFAFNLVQRHNLQLRC